MKIFGNIELIDLATYANNALIVSDFHIGYEEALNKQGLMIPRFQFQEIINRLDSIFKRLKNKKIERIIINGDLKHEFGTISDQEWRHTLKLLDYLGQHCKEIILIKGNHDTILGPIAEKRNVKVLEHYIINSIDEKTIKDKINKQILKNNLMIEKNSKKESIIKKINNKTRENRRFSVNLEIQKEFPVSQKLQNDFLGSQKSPISVKSIKKISIINRSDKLISPKNNKKSLNMDLLKKLKINKKKSIFKNKINKILLKKTKFNKINIEKSKNKILCLHGDKIPHKELLEGVSTIIIGHEHPAVSIREGPRAELFKAFLIGKWHGLNVIALPSFNLVVEGTDVLKEEVLSPFLKGNLREFDVVVVGDKLYWFGKVKNL